MAKKSSQRSSLPSLDDERSIRLLGFSRFCVNGTLSCTLEAASIKSSYFALSYLWGDSDERQNICCNGEIIGITTNLHEALDQLWKQYPDRKIWADAICINQEDQVEKAVQVAMMGQIYVGATEVIVWLGNEMVAADVEYLFYQLAKSTRDAVRCTDCGEVDGHLSNCPICPIYPLDAREQRYKLYRLLSEVRCNAWFQRMWTFQEICLTDRATVHLGAGSMSWEEFIDGLISYFGRTPDDHWLAELKWITSHMGKFGENANLTRLLRATCRRKAHEPRDKIYALLGLLRLRFLQSPGYETLERVDYTVPVGELYTEITRLCFHVDNYVELIRNSWASRTSGTAVKDLPSWAIDWTRNSQIADPYWANSSVQRTFEPRSKLSQSSRLSVPLAKAAQLDVYFIVLGTLDSTNHLEVGATLPIQKRSSAWEPHPLCVQQSRSLRTKRAKYYARSSHDIKGGIILIHAEDICELSSRPSNCCTLLSQLQSHKQGTCDCLPIVCSERNLWRGDDIQYQRAQAGDWFGIIANRNGFSMNTLAVVRPTAKSGFRLIAWTRDPQVVVSRPGAIVVESAFDKFTRSFHIFYILTHIVLE
jgi:hypothetical protein